MGLMASATVVIPLGLLHMTRVSASCLCDLAVWKQPWFLSRGVSIGGVHHHILVTTDASLTGCGAFCDSLPVYGVWRSEHWSWHINCLELIAVYLALSRFLPMVQGYQVLVRTDNPPRGMLSCHMWLLVRHILIWYAFHTPCRTSFCLSGQFMFQVSPVC